MNKQRGKNEKTEGSGNNNKRFAGLLFAPREKKRALFPPCPLLRNANGDGNLTVRSIVE